MELPIQILYLGLHNQLKQKWGVGHVVSRKEFFCKLGKHYMIPKDLRVIVIKEMEGMLLIKQENRDNLLICDCKWDLERDAKKFYKFAGIY